MHLAIPRPFPKRLAPVVKQYPKKAEYRDEAHIHHNRRDVAGLDDPRGYKFGEAIDPNVFIDG